MSRRASFVIQPADRARLRDVLAIILSRHPNDTSHLRQLCVNLVEIYDASSSRRYIGVYGQQKAGKSTLFNSIVGEEVLPVKAIPTTGSIIDLIRNERASDYTVTAYRNQAPFPRKFSTAAEVCAYLDKVATQKDPFDKVEVEAAFENACSFMTSGCVLRDTPGAIADPEDALADRLKEDSQKTIASLDEVCIPIFCVNGDAIGSQDDKNLYDAYLRDRLCLHVITHRDGDDNTGSIADFDEKFGIYHDKIAENPVICTGKSTRKKPFVDIGLKELAGQISAFLDEASLSVKMLKMAEYIMQKQEELPWVTDVVLMDNLKQLIDRIKEDENR